MTCVCVWLNAVRTLRDMPRVSLRSRPSQAGQSATEGQAAGPARVRTALPLETDPLARAGPRDLDQRLCLATLHRGCARGKHCMSLRDPRHLASWLPQPELDLCVASQKEVLFA